jgi:hypothetical protein
MIESDAQSRLKVTGWPGAAVEVPTVLAWDVVEVREVGRDWWIEYDFFGRSTRDVVLPVDTYLREALDVDFADVEALADFGAQFGILGWWHEEEMWWPGLPRQARTPVNSPDTDMAWLNDLIQACKGQRLLPWADPSDVDYVDYVEADPRPNPFTGVIHADEVRLYLSFIHDMVSLWRCVRGGIGLAEVAAGWSNRVYAAPTEYDDVPVVLADFLNPALAAQSLRIEVVNPDDIGKTPSVEWGRPPLNTYQALCSQLRNDIAMNSEYYICANEPCRRLFSKYRPRDTETITRLKAGSRYCSPSCGEAQKAREFRQSRSAGRPTAPYKRRPPIKANGIRPD